MSAYKYYGWSKVRWCSDSTFQCWAGCIYHVIKEI